MEQDGDPVTEPFVYLPPHTRQASKAILLLLFFSFLMFSLPFGAFYGTKYVLKEYYDITGYANTVWGVLAAVVTVNVIILTYAYIAYKEEEYDDQGNVISADSDTRLKED